MIKRNTRSTLTVLAGMVALLLAGCSSAQPEAVKNSPLNGEPAAGVSETQQVAEAALGKSAKVLAHGDLARNGLEQILIANQQATDPGEPVGSANPAGVLITRAVIVEKKDDQWTEILRCDEHLKNPRGYLGNSPKARVSGWRLEFDQDTNQGLEMKFRPADSETDRQPVGDGEFPFNYILVRWNSKVKRYQSLDQSQGRYLTEIPTLETPQTTLR